MTGTKRAVFEAALLKFAEKGYASASMRDIAEAVGIKAASLYNYYPGKDSILGEVYAFVRNLAPESDSGAEAAQEAEGAAAILAAQSLGYIDRFDDPLIGAAWTVVSEEQYIDPRAAELIVEVTERFMGALAALFERLGGPETGELAVAYGYASRALHLEYGLRRRHGLPTGEVLGRMRTLAETFGALLDERKGEDR